MKYTFPANYGEDCIIIEIDKALVPLVAGALRPFEQRYSWATEEDYEQGYNAFAQLQAQFMGKCVEQINRAIFFAMGYPRDVVLDSDGFPSVELPEASLFAIRTRLGDPGDFTIYSRVEAIRLLLANANSLDDEMLAELVKIAALLAV